ncbi:MAG: hypothetical protein PHE09_09220 [Oscillospiraceae bacterium]|nr:hypothetical protein [Oscillospiraceae bacterium]
MEEEKQQNKPFSHPRWNEPIGGKVVGHKTQTEEEQKQVHDDAVAVLKSMGVKIKDDKDTLHDDEGK